ncbi:putative ZWF1-glucose-6-phosphate dehydrogenase [Rhizopus microsporus ATCC 52813]|uniref:Glucose-6-phosphate 1-dehydrogenase n=2 Tax=Rhizopus microsporus TaxID=58291 RepID=A0A2G4SZC5_RHIZD|nr:putative ZWF1-glucose-6-phosphate dehydrogenase [Rhizopus microsporus ATCC 52813]PHZ14118.1 putative ZWF1-glucose-6-phosphate dehydrogenase [Rhizopus microsporus ATCC 52813]
MTSPVQVLCEQLTVLGASGDLAKKKTYPALFGLYRNGFLPENTRIIGYARTKMSHEDYINRITQYIKIQDADKLEQFKKMTFYVSGQYDEDASFQKLREAIEQSEKERAVKKKNRVYYMALPPSVFIPVAQGIKRNVYTTEGSNRLVVEKPFGMDSESSAHLGRELGALFTENEIYRIDHYLGKEMVKNIMNLRFANVLFGHAWNRTYIDNVQITFKEPFGTEGRGGYFDEFGIIRDVIQNHLLQVLTLVAMERPISTDAEAIRDEKVKVLKCISPIKIEDTLLGQYVAADGKPGYLEDETLKNKDSLTPTFAAAVCFVNNERWEGVPFILKAGKALNEAKVEVRLQFHRVAGNLYGDSPRNELVIRIQPKEAVYMKFNNKQPGLSYQTIQTDLDLSYHERYTDLAIPDAYESLILDVLRNDHSNFVRDDELTAAWNIFTPLLHKIDRHDDDVDIKKYPYGSRGPQELDEFVKKYGYHRDTSGYTWPRQNVNPSTNKL